MLQRIQGGDEHMLSRAEEVLNYLQNVKTFYRDSLIAALLYYRCL